MGRGGRKAGQQVHIDPRAAFSGAPNTPLVKDLSAKTERVPYDVWKKQEATRIKEISEELKKKSYDFAGSDSGWKSYLQDYVDSPYYSPKNMQWAAIQLEKKGGNGPGLIFSESIWAQLGRRVKEDHCRPLKKRDAKFDYASGRDWDDKYTCEMLAPQGFWAEKDKDGNLYRDKDGNPKKRWINTSGNEGPTTYRSFTAYHEDATEALDGGTPPPLPETPWEAATGSAEDAFLLLGNLEEIIEKKGLKLQEEDLSANKRESAKLRQKEIVVDKTASPAEQANAVLGCLCEYISNNENSSNTDESKEANEAAIASAQYVIAKLYKLDNAEQTFPNLRKIRERKGGIDSVGGKTHGIVNTILTEINPITRQKLTKPEYKKKDKSKAKAKV